MELSSYRSNHLRLEPEECSTAVEHPWYALKVRTRSEHIASTALRNRGYEPFLPSYRETKRFCDRVKTLERPAFPGYMFCRFDANSKTRILSSPAILYIVSFAGQPAIVPAESIEAVRRAIAAGGQPSNYMPAGLQVRITSGPLAGLEGMLLRTGKHNQIVVSVHLLQRSVAITIREIAYTRYRQQRYDLHDELCEFELGWLLTVASRENQEIDLIDAFSLRRALDRDLCHIHS